MECPVDHSTLVIAERAGIEIDYCPKCRGVWLDRGELDKIIDASATSHSEFRPERSEYRPDRYESTDRERRDGHYRDDRHQDRHYDDHGHYGKKKRRESFLGDLFDGLGGD